MAGFFKSNARAKLLVVRAILLVVRAILPVLGLEFGQVVRPIRGS